MGLKRGDQGDKLLSLECHFIRETEIIGYRTNDQPNLDCFVGWAKIYPMSVCLISSNAKNIEHK